MMKRFFACWAIAVLFALPIQSQDLPEWDSLYVNDYADILSDEVEAQLTEMIRSRWEARDHQMTVVTVPEMARYGDYSRIEELGKDLFNHWGIGNAETNDGVLLLVAVGDRKVRIQLGDGYPARWDGIAKRIIDRDILPEFRDNQFEQGILNGTRASLAQLDMSNGVEPELTLIERFNFWLNERPGLVIPALMVVVLSFPFVALALPFLLFRGIRGLIRRRPRKCPECGRIMLRLGDAQEDQYLEAGQILEEKISAKDYGVWFCEHDEHLTIVGYPRLRSRHKACPECGYHTYETRRTTMRPPTYNSEGLARLDSNCIKCGHSAVRDVSIPRRTRSSSSSSGSGSSSGGFGGGSSSGGGASGSW